MDSKDFINKIYQRINYLKQCNFSKNSNEEINNEEIIDENITNKIKIIKKEEIITGAAAVGILFIFALIINVIINMTVTELRNTLNPLQIMMFFNLVPVKIYSSTIFGSGVIIVKLGIIILTLFPIIAITLANRIFLKNKNSKSILSNVLGVGITYATLMAILSLIASMGYKFTNLIEYGITVKYDYNLLSTFFNGYILATICTYFTRFKYKYENRNLYLNIFDKVIKTICISYVLILIILVIFTISDKSYLSEIGLYSYADNVGIVTVITQLAMYMLAFSNFIPIKIDTIAISPFNILNSSLFLDTKLIFFSMIAASLLINLIIGYNLKEDYKENDIKPVFIFSILYALFMGGLSIFSSIMIVGDISFFGLDNLQPFIKMGFSFISTILISFIYSFIVSLVGYKLNDNESICEYENKFLP